MDFEFTGEVVEPGRKGDAFHGGCLSGRDDMGEPSNPTLEPSGHVFDTLNPRTTALT